jgi:hypothetical protein
VEDFLSSVDQWTQDLCKELNAKTEERQLGSKAVTMSLIADTKDLNTQLNLWILETQFNIQATKTLAETIQCGIGEAEAQGELGTCGRIGKPV